jgi:uncharacterized DUF497 family protein
VRFEWDDEKAISNLEKHGVSFGEATEVFYDPNALAVMTLGTPRVSRVLLSSGCRVAGYCM